MLKIACKLNAENEFRYIIQVIFGHILGVQWCYVCMDLPYIRITSEDTNGELRLAQSFFTRANHACLAMDNLPNLPLVNWDSRELSHDIALSTFTIPVIFGDNKPKLTITDNTICLPIDIFGSAFFMLSRYEEAVLPDRDSHGRFPATASLAYRAGFLDRPIIDEYVEILWAAMKRLWPSLQRKPQQRKVRVTCDVDSPYFFYPSITAPARMLATDLLEHRSLDRAASHLAARWRTWRGDYHADPHYSAIQWMMDVNEKVGRQMAFYFIPDRFHPRLDGRYRLSEPRIRGLLRNIHARGHEIGLHASYNSYLDAEQTCREAAMLRNALLEEGIEAEVLGGRQHFLRWQTSVTARNWEAAGMLYDSTLCYADRPGFRCGTSREYPMYDLQERRPLALRQRPLIVMECSVIADRYMGLGYSDEALALMLRLKDRALQFGGEFTLLWHNSHLANDRDRFFYETLIQ